MFTLLNISLIITSVFNLLLGFFVLRKNIKNAVNASYFLFAFGIFLWAITNAIFQITNSYILSFIVAIIAYYAGALLSLSFFYFTLVFPQEKSNLKNYHRKIILVWAIIWFFIVTLPDITLKDILFDNQIKGLLTGPGLLFHFISIAALMFGGIINLFVKFHKSQGSIRQQILYVLIGVMVATIFGILFNLILPLAGNYSFVWLGPIFSVFILITTAYAIVRYHLMDIWMIVRLGAIFTILFTIISFIYVFVGSMIGQYFDHTISHFISSLIIVAGFIPLKNFVEFSTDKIFFRKRYKFADIMGEAEKIIHQSGLNLDKILEDFNRVIVSALKVRRAVILILTPKNHFISRQTIGDITTEINPKPDNPIITYFQSNKDHIIDEDTLKPNSVKNNSNLIEAVKELKRIGFSFAVPIDYEGELIGVHLLGPKMSLDPFTKEDIHLLKHISGEMAFAIENARMFEELKKLDQTKSEFISVASHQLRTPVSIIKWNLELAMDKETSEQEKNELFKIAYDNSDEMGHQLDKLITAFEIEDRNIFVDKKEGCLKSLILKRLEKVKKILKTKNLAVETDFASDIPETVNYDFDKMSKVIDSLIQNAITYTPAGGKIKIGLRKENLEEKDRLVAFVSDNGIGIDEYDYDNIFKKFFRSQGARYASPNGFGLELFIAKKFINAHGGDIWFEPNKETKGTIFYFSIPMENNQQSSLPRTNSR